MIEDDTELYYTTEVVTTVRFTVRHFKELDKEEMLLLIPDLINFDQMIGDGGDPEIVGISVISDEIENPNIAVIEE